MTSPRAVGDSGPAVLDLRDPHFWTEPLPLLRAARERGRTALTAGGEPVLLRADDVEFAHADPRFSNPGVANLERLGISDGPFYEWRKRTLAAIEGEGHRRLRSFIGRLFSPRQTARLREAFRAHANSVLDRAAERETLDIVTQYASELPLWGICHFLGIPDTDRERIGAFMVGTEEGFSAAMTPEIRERAERSIEALTEYARKLIRRCAERPGPDALSELVASRRHADGVSDEDFLALIVNLIGGAVGSTRSAISNSVFLLLSHPEQARLVRLDPERARPAVEECLRLSPPFRIGRRVAVDSVTACGLDLSAGDSVLIWRMAANRDPERFERPDEFDIERPIRPHASFGHGAHFCLGQALARVEVQEALTTLLTRFPRAELITREPKRIPFTMDEQIASLSVRLI
ncbi:MAG: cytochrome P450 [Proteobacteria bacterium]|nr:cytochrome P450 [Pseudomonadota bacterium]